VDLAGRLKRQVADLADEAVLREKRAAARRRPLQKLHRHPPRVGASVEGRGFGQGVFLPHDGFGEDAHIHRAQADGVGVMPRQLVDQVRVLQQLAVGASDPRRRPDLLHEEALGVGGRDLKAADQLEQRPPLVGQAGPCVPQGLSDLRGQ